MHISFAKIKRPMYIEIPIEDKEDCDEKLVGKLNLSLYGTRDAAQNWQNKFIEYLISHDFKKGKTSPCNFWHPKYQLHLIVHGDGFTTIGPDKSLRWFEKLLNQRYECKHKMLGPGGEDTVRVLNRVLNWKEDGIHYEADQRHAELVVAQLKLDEARSVITLGTREEQVKSFEQESPLMNPNDASSYRMLVARLNYLALGRPDIQYATKEIAKRMANPCEHHWQLLKRICKFLKGAPRLIQRFEWLSKQIDIVGYSDSDWAGDLDSRKSTSGGACMIASHTIKTWASSQQVIALSSAEVELYALIKCACQSIGLISLAGDFGISLKAQVMTDASAALGIAQRKGLGKLRHIDVQWLWLQEKVQRGNLKASKINVKETPADLLTKHLSCDDMKKHLTKLGFELRSDRSDKSLKLGAVHNEGEDYWTREDQCTIRWHRRPRNKLFSPFQVAGSPSMSALTSTRVIHGKYVDSEETVFIQDNWTCRTQHWRNLERSWTGRTVFIPTTDTSCVEESKSVSLVKIQQEVWRRNPINKKYGSESRAEVLTREWKKALCNYYNERKECHRGQRMLHCLTQYQNYEHSIDQRPQFPASLIPSGSGKPASCAGGQDACELKRHDGQQHRGPGWGCRESCFSSDHLPLVVLQAPCARACAAAKLMPQRHPFLSVSRCRSPNNEWECCKNDTTNNEPRASHSRGGLATQGVHGIQFFDAHQLQTHIDVGEIDREPSKFLRKRHHDWEQHCTAAKDNVTATSYGLGCDDEAISQPEMLGTAEMTRSRESDHEEYSGNHCDEAKCVHRPSPPPWLSLRFFAKVGARSNAHATTDVGPHESLHTRTYHMTLRGIGHCQACEPSWCEAICPTVCHNIERQVDDVSIQSPGATPSPGSHPSGFDPGPSDSTGTLIPRACSEGSKRHRGVEVEAAMVRISEGSMFVSRFHAGEFNSCVAIYNDASHSFDITKDANFVRPYIGSWAVGGCRHTLCIASNVMHRNTNVVNDLMYDRPISRELLFGNAYIAYTLGSMVERVCKSLDANAHMIRIGLMLGFLCRVHTFVLLPTFGGSGRDNVLKFPYCGARPLEEGVHPTVFPFWCWQSARNFQCRVGNPPDSFPSGSESGRFPGWSWCRVPSASYCGLWLKPFEF